MLTVGIVLHFILERDFVMEQLSALLWSACPYELDQKWPHIFIMHLELVSVYFCEVWGRV